MLCTRKYVQFTVYCVCHLFSEFVQEGIKPASVTILDSDSKLSLLEVHDICNVSFSTGYNTALTISFKESAYTVKENEGNLHVCMSVSETPSEQVTVELTAANGSAVDG